MKDLIIFYFEGQELFLSPEILTDVPALIVWDKEEGAYIETPEATFANLRKYDKSYIQAKQDFLVQFTAMNYHTFDVHNQELGVVFDSEKDLLYAGGICNAGVCREYEVEIDYELSLDENLELLLQEIEKQYLEGF